MNPQQALAIEAQRTKTFKKRADDLLIALGAAGFGEAQPVRNRRRTAPPTPVVAAPHPYGSSQPHCTQQPSPPNAAPHNENWSNRST
ncbi:hypothetical protein OHA04_13335 [Streptomyces sp. NBC_01590]|uniref:hypothetical protein n=1 Tax=Streptomyces sp. NBC_01590 TaxID=2975887 RepID=UPI0038703764